MQPPKIIIFSDLDGTLLDHDTYSFLAAQDALKYLSSNQIPLILVSSKTRREMLIYQQEFGIDGLPFVVENGAAIYTARDYFNLQPAAVSMDGLACYRFGITYDRIRQILDRISEKYDYIIRGFHNSSRDEIIQKTGLDDTQAAMAMQREFSIPLFYDEKAQKILKAEIDEHQLTILFGGRFMHLLGKSNKGDALRNLMNMYQQKYPGANLLSVAAGDSPNDIDMLQESDYAILVKRHDGTHASVPDIADLIYASGIGPVGWNSEILSVLHRIDQLAHRAGET